MNRRSASRGSARNSARTRVGAVAAALLITAGATGAALAAEKPAARPAAGVQHPQDPSLTGSGTMRHPDGDDVRFAFDARFPAGKNPTHARGGFRFSHVYADGSGRGFAEGRIDCLVPGGQVAVATGIVTRTDVRGLRGRRVGFTVHDRGRHDRLGYSWAATSTPAKDTIPPCVSSAPIAAVERGDFTVVPWSRTN